MAQAEKVSFAPEAHYDLVFARLLNLLSLGGKVKPLKSAKKDKKDLDEDDLAYKEKQRAGTLPL